MKIFCQKFITLLLAAAVFAGSALCLCPSAGAIDDPDLLPEAALLVDLDSGAVLYSKNAETQRAPGSLTKIMTVLLAVEAYEAGDISLTDLIDVDEGAYYDVGQDASTAGLKVGEQLTFEQLLYCAMLESANEGCNVIARAVSGDATSFISLMNTRAQELGCTGTNFANTHGLPNDHHYTTAQDLYLITASALTHSLFKRIISTDTYTIPATNMSEERVLRNTNNLINPSSTYYYEYASGVKTGYTDAAGFCLVSTANKEGRRLLAVVLGAQSVVLEDGRTQVQSFSESKRLLEWGFNNFSVKDLLTTLKLMAEIPVELGLGTSSVVLRPAQNVQALLPNDVDLSEVELEPVIYPEGPITAPVEEGTVLGAVTVRFNGVDYGTVNLVTNTKVELDRAAYIGSEIRGTLSNKYVRLAVTVLIVLLILYVAFIVYYNVRRIRKRRAAAALARKRVEEYRQSQETTTGKTFEEIEARHRERHEAENPRRRSRYEEDDVPRRR